MYPAPTGGHNVIKNLLNDGLMLLRLACVGLAMLESFRPCWEVRCSNRLGCRGLGDVGIVGDCRGNCDVGIVLPLAGFVMFESFGLCGLCDAGIISLFCVKRSSGDGGAMHNSRERLGAVTYSFPGGCCCDERSGGDGGAGAVGTGTPGGRGLVQTHTFPWRLLL